MRRGHDERALALLEAELARAGLESDSEPDEPADDSDAESEPVVQILRRCMSASVTLQWPAGRWTGLPEEERMLCDACEAAEP